MHGGGCHVGQTILCACMYMHAALPMSAPEFPMARRQRQHDMTCVSHTHHVVVRCGLARPKPMWRVLRNQGSVTFISLYSSKHYYRPPVPPSPRSSALRLATHAVTFCKGVPPAGRWPTGDAPQRESTRAEGARPPNTVSSRSF